MEVLNHNVLVKLDNAKEVTDGGIVIPDKFKEKPTSGIIKFAPEQYKHLSGRRAHFMAYAAHSGPFTKDELWAVSIKDTIYVTDDV